MNTNRKLTSWLSRAARLLAACGLLLALASPALALQSQPGRSPPASRWPGRRRLRSRFHIGLGSAVCGSTGQLLPDRRSRDWQCNQQKGISLRR